ncbi:UNVERIFIED_CONTAM: Arginine--tRNA ligase, chloroplastic/mitochondrial [Sesamum radiatum]|uniref:arginine--tRNA ligase n=1 Tax=Sesamum radiatum TaxID=300843 RepID=A0AAW2M656_SESRA
MKLGDVIYNAMYPLAAPDIIFGPEDESFQPVYGSNGKSRKSSLADWNSKDAARLLSLIIELRDAYIAYQRRRIEQVDDDRLKFEISTMLSREGIEMYMTSGADKPEEVKFAVPLLDMELNKLVAGSTWRHPQKIYLQVVFPVGKKQSTPPPPRLKLVSSAELKAIFSIEDFRLPPWLDGMCTAEYLPTLEEMLEAQIKDAVLSVETRRKFITALVPLFGRPIEADPPLTHPLVPVLCPSLLEDSHVQINCHVTIAATWATIYPVVMIALLHCWLFDSVAASFSYALFWQVHFSLSLQFPKHQPGLTLQSSQHFNSNGMLVKSPNLAEYPWSPRWEPSEMADRILLYNGCYISSVIEAGILKTSRRLFLRAKASSPTTMANEEVTGGSLKQQLAKLFEESLRITVPEELDVDPAIAPCQNPKFGDYQCNNAMGLWSKVKGKGTQFKGPQPIGQAIMKNLPASEMVDSCSIAGPGFVNVVLSRQWIAKSIQKMLVDGIETWAPKLPVKRAVVDFSSPNIAKEMHVGHLRSTIIGDTLARMLEYSNVEVLRRNHVGDWGTQFGMLIEYLFEKFPSGEVASDQAIGDLETFYKASKQRFDSDPAFKERAQRAVVSLQAGDEKYRKAWAHICEISRRGYEKVYQRLGVHLEEKGESFYNPYIPGALELLSKKGLIEESEGARVIFIEGKNIPLIVVKKDGGTTMHQLILLLCGKAKDWTEEELEKTAEAVGYGAVKYADLKNNRTTNYTFSFDQMLNDKTGTLDLVHPDERMLGLHLLQFAEVVEEACTNLLPNVLCEYLYNLSEDFTRFYTNCQVVGSAEETSRLLLCEATAVVMRKCFHLLGITPVYKI